jgi:putative DNA methylase
VAECEGARVYLTPTDATEAVAGQANPKWKPETPIPPDKRSMFTPLYGLTHFHHLFTPRQLVTLTTFSALVQQAREAVKRDAVAVGLPDDDRSVNAGGTGAYAYADALAVYLSFSVSKAADRNSSLCVWEALWIECEGLLDARCSRWFGTTLRLIHLLALAAIFTEPRTHFVRFLIKL